MIMCLNLSYLTHLLSRLSDLYLRPRFHFADFLWTFPVKNSIQKSSWLHLIFPDFYIEFKKGSEGATVLSLTLKSKRFTNTLPHKLVHRILWPPGGLQFPNWLRSRFFLIACANARYPGFWKEVTKHSFYIKVVCTHCTANGILYKISTYVVGAKAKCSYSLPNSNPVTKVWIS